MEVCLVLSVMSASGLSTEGIFTSFLKSGKRLSRTGGGRCEIDKADVVLHAGPQHRKKDVQIHRRDAEFHWSFLTASGRVWAVIPNILSRRYDSGSPTTEAVQHG